MALLPTSIAAIVEAITRSFCSGEVVLGPVAGRKVNFVEGGKSEVTKSGAQGLRLL
jgi:hypothetical protein